MANSPGLRGSIVGCYEKFSSGLNQWQSVPLLIIRLYFGYQCAQAGIRHLETFDLTVARFVYWRIPFPSVSAALMGGTEVICGLAIYMGLLSRVASIALIVDFFVTMLVVNLSAADFSMHQALLNIWNDQDYILKDSSFPFLMTALVILFFGPGWVSVDGLVRYWVQRRANPNGLA